jgi:protein SDA1
VKRGLSVCAELWRRQIWRDARTVNVIAAATSHKSTSVMLAALKFFLGQDLAGELDDADQDDESADANAPPSKAEVYRTYHKVILL